MNAENLTKLDILLRDLRGLYARGFFLLLAGDIRKELREMLLTNYTNCCVISCVRSYTTFYTKGAQRMTYKQLLVIIRKCEALHDKAAERGINDPARNDKEYRGIIDMLTNENYNSMALLLEHYRFKGAKWLLKGMFA